MKPVAPVMETVMGGCWNR